jgi:hypothetical protein
LLSGLTAIASGGALAWVVKRRDEATDAERTAFREAALGTTAVGALEQASREPPLRSSSAGFR